jgi:hypothetical protein
MYLFGDRIELNVYNVLGSPGSPRVGEGSSLGSTDSDSMAGDWSLAPTFYRVANSSKHYFWKTGEIKVGSPQVQRSKRSCKVMFLGRPISPGRPRYSSFSAFFSSAVALILSVIFQPSLRSITA